MNDSRAVPTAAPAQPKAWTPAQLAAIETRGRTLLVSAAAGSGKTSTLTERVIRLLTDPVDPHDVSRMVIVTFTVAAANDLKAKLTQALNDAIKNSPGNPHLAEQLLLLSDADIGTIDGFCRRIVTEFSDCAGLSPSYRVCDPNEEAHLLRSVLDPYIDRLFAGSEPREGEIPPTESEERENARAFSAFVSTAVESRSQDDLSKIILTVREQAQNYPEGVGKLDAFADYIEAARTRPPEETVFGKALLRRLADRFRDAAKEAEELEIDLPGEAPETQAVVGPALKAIRDAARVLADPAVTYDAAREIVLRFGSEEKGVSPIKLDFGTAFAKKATKEYKESLLPVLSGSKDNNRLFADVLGFVPFFRPSSADWNAEAGEHVRFSRLLSRIVRRFDELVREEKRRRGVASFADVERAALAVLTNPDGSKTDVAKAIASRYDAVFVDEYQDVNPIQHAIFEAIATPDDRFLVGDVKQSIYAFRRAEPGIFIKMKTSFRALPDAGESDAAKIPLSENFRCDKPIIDFVNAVFSPLFGAVGDSIGYEEGSDALVFAKNSDPARAVAPAVRIFGNRKFYCGDDPDAPAPDAECDWVAREIDRLIHQERRPDGSAIKAEDVAILLRKEKHTADFRTALRARGIPVSVETKEDFFESPEIRLALCLLNAVDNPRRDVPLVGLLRSPLYDFSPDRLVDIRRAAPDEPFYDALLKYCEKHPDFDAGARFLAQLAAFRRAAEGLPVDRLILKLFTETGLLPISGAANPDNGREKLLLFYQYARSFEATSFRGLYRFIAYVNDLAADEKKFSMQPPSNAKGVRIMTVHHSKGLEFPVVFLARTLHSVGGNRSLTTDGNVSFNPRFGLTTKLRDADGLARIETPFRLISEQEKKLLDKEEELRVLYVALTRARDRLYVTGTVQNTAKVENKIASYETSPACSRSAVLSKSTFLDWIVLAAGGLDGLGKRATVTVPDPSDVAAPDPSPETAPAETAAKEPAGIPDEHGALLTEEEAEKILSARFAFDYPFPWLKSVPGKFSVSILSPAVLDGADEGTKVYAPKKAREETVLPRFLSGRTDAADPALRGTATHEFLQFCDLSLLLAHGADAELNRLISGGFLQKSARDLVNLTELEAFRASSLAEEMLAARKMRRELRFNMMLPASELTGDAERKERLKNHPVLVQGVMDCVFETAEGELVLLDYKTDRLKGGADADEAELAAFVERHVEQLRYYSIAIEKMFGRPADRILLYPLCLGRPIPVTLPDEKPAPQV